MEEWVRVHGTLKDTFYCLLLWLKFMSITFTTVRFRVFESVRVPSVSHIRFPSIDLPSALVSHPLTRVVAALHMSMYLLCWKMIDHTTSIFRVPRGTVFRAGTRFIYFFSVLFFYTHNTQCVYLILVIRSSGCRAQ